MYSLGKNNCGDFTCKFWALAQPSKESMHLIKDGAMIVKYGRSIKEDL